MTTTLFRGFANVWSPVALSKEVGFDAPVGLQLASTKIVLFRDQSGKLGALVDRCVHRGVALSLGRVEDGCLTCPFHGWRFDTSGRVASVPWNPDAKTSHLRAVDIPVVEAGGFVWVYTAAGAAPAVGPSVPAFALRPDLHLSAFSVTFETHWTRLMENMLDWPHLPFVHRGSIGKGMLKKRDARMDIDLKPTSTGFLTTISIDGEPQEGSLELRHPNQMVLTIMDGRRTLIMLNTCIPIDDTKTRLLVVTARSFLRHAMFDFAFELSNRRIVSEDRAVVESSWPTAVPQANEEASVRTDAPTLAFRKWYFANLHDSSASADTGGRVALRVAR